MLTFDNVLHDVFFAQGPFIKGTETTFVVNRSTKRTLKSVFDRFAREEFDYSFSTTEVLVKLLATAYISRSEAKRLLAGLEKFKEIMLDFRGVESVGQGFADEVFPRAHPGIRTTWSRAVPAVDVMIRHVVDKTGSSAG
jgi:hypothetical protein